MIINNTNYSVIDVYDLPITIPDSFVAKANKTCKGNGEAKLYMGPKKQMRSFFTGDALNAGFSVTCMLLKDDLLSYLETIHHEYSHPSIKYRGMGTHKNMNTLWNNRVDTVRNLTGNVIFFDIKDQQQISGERGYVKTTGNPLKGGYGLIREISLPFVSYISVMKLQNDSTGDMVFYWKLFTDFSQMALQQYRATHYGKKSSRVISTTIRDGQTKYRQKLLSLFGHCPFSQIDDATLLVASHIKPWAVCNNVEKTDVDNGLMLSPLFDKLFDKGFITFEDNGDLKISDWLSSANQSRIDFSYQKGDLHLDAGRKAYLQYHRQYVFK